MPKFTKDFLLKLRTTERKVERKREKIRQKLKNLGFVIDLCSEEVLSTKNGIAKHVMSYPENLEKLGKEKIRTEKEFLESYVDCGTPGYVRINGFSISSYQRNIDNVVTVLVHPAENFSRDED